MKKDINEVSLSGFICDDIEVVTEFYGVKVLKTSLKVERNSGKIDILPIFFSETLRGFDKIENGSYLGVIGTMRSVQKKDINGIKRTIVYMQVSKIVEPYTEYENTVVLTGRFLKKPVLRKAKTMPNVDVLEVVLVVDRGFNKEVHIPIVIWGSNARITSKFDKDTKVRILGRFQSRCIIRRSDFSEYGFEEAVSYEVSVKEIKKEVD